MDPARISLSLTIAVLSASGTFACADPAGTEQIALADLVGVWEATEITVTNELDPTLMEDLFELGVRWEMSVTSDGAVTIVFSNPFGSDGYSGTVALEGDSLVVLRSSDDSPPGPPVREAVHCVRAGEALRLTWAGTEQCGSYGWSAPDCPIPVTFRMRIERLETQ